MKARLTFALSTAIEADVLALDEWIGAGDAAFISQAQERLTGLLHRTQILILSSHSLDLIKNVCNVAAWMERGRIVLIGPPELVVDAYLASTAPPVLAAAE
jgi:ABC-2 type transport system ATP-binding protein/lipopolysaccharide transport system ATP-binding protein